MEVIKTSIEGVAIVVPRVFRDTRGYFFESFSQRDFEAAVGRKVDFVQDNESMSSYGVMRGLHFQRPPFTQTKLVRCVKGAVLDVAVDIRKGSPTYGQHVSCLLCGSDMDNEEAKLKLAASSSFSCEEIAAAVNRQFFIAKGFAHGFAVLSDTAVFQYKCDEYYHPESDGGISILDDTLGIDWHIPTGSAILSEKDTRHTPLKDFDTPFTF